MAITPDSTAQADDFINESERDADPTNDSGRVPKFESNGHLSKLFLQNIISPNAGEDIIDAEALGISVANTHYITLTGASEGRLSCADSASISTTGDLTLELNVRFDSVASTQYLIQKGRSGAASQQEYELRFDFNGGSPELTLTIGDGGSIDAGMASWSPSADTWYHVAVTFDDSANEVEFFVDGASIGTDTISTSTQDGGSGVDIGVNKIDGTTFNSEFAGDMDDIRIWTITRTGAEILATKNMVLNGDETGLGAYWKFDNDLLDATANDNDLTDANGDSTFTSGGAFGDTSAFVFLASAGDSISSDKFIGFATQTKTKGNAVNAAVASVIETSGLSPGKQYYLSDTPGAISTTAGTVTRKVGIALSTTELLITNIW